MTDLLPATSDFQSRAESAFQVLTTAATKIWSLPLQQCNLRIESTSPSPTPSITFRLTITAEMLNGGGALHGGCASTLIDDLTTVFLAAVSRPGLYSQYGVTRNIRVAFFEPLVKGGDVRVVCGIEHVGRRLVLLGARVYDARGRICVMGENEKVNTDSKVKAAL
ncbi:thioesterase family protein [Aspergillus steynii IBT 23096]|uniref:Thioesterase family protein n=1 Tax=Aspergillus steynii IBT 23096 TaxID=1392250 RepID=A0A2I2GGG4_9EURO|nr:thioesterase family protein [Aspergillus steynii IBT 23096]PLB51974.1 thioesterase family protein [Aspergillus steynii IBT 23096]